MVPEVGTFAEDKYPGRYLRLRGTGSTFNVPRFAPHPVPAAAKKEFAVSGAGCYAELAVLDAPYLKPYLKKFELYKYHRSQKSVKHQKDKGSNSM